MDHELSIAVEIFKFTFLFYDSDIVEISESVTCSSLFWFWWGIMPHHILLLMYFYQKRFHNYSTIIKEEFNNEDSRFI
jgi:hypothetical protein